ncbi:MAG: OFA family MFS transporter [Candidatus Lokiarchaeota archaeon]|nr:OFA family MFS transporter [Candidatus Lokiarchaeota archaeon]
MSEKFKGITEKLNPIKNRWFVVIGAILVQLALGTIYSWSTVSAFATPYMQGFDSSITGEMTVYIFGVSLLAFAITMIFAGQLQQKIGPMKVAMIGGIVLGIGVIGSSFTAGSFLGLMITYGVIFGVGIGFAYVCPIACAAKWFPDKKGLINGIAVAGFGAGSFIFNYVIRALGGVSVILMFVMIGIIYLVMVLIGALTLIDPPEGWAPAGWTPPPPSVEDGVSGLEFERKEMIKTPQFWMLWLSFVLSAICGLMTIGAYKDFANSQPTGLINDLTFIATIGAFAALFNGLGRIVWGLLSDKISYKKSMMIMFILQGIFMISFFFTTTDPYVYLVFVCLIYFCFGGNFSMFPTATGDLFGTKKLGPNYGIVFTAYGIAGFMGATMVNLFVSAFGSYLILFVVMGIMSLGAAVIAFVLKPPTK